jgi:hypothetical protein
LFEFDFRTVSLAVPAFQDSRKKLAAIASKKDLHFIADKV